MLPQNAPGRGRDATIRLTLQFPSTTAASSYVDMDDANAPSPLLADVEAYRKTMFDYPRTELDPPAESMFNLNHSRPWYWKYLRLVVKDDVPALKTRGEKDAKSIYCLRCHRAVQSVDGKLKSIDTRAGTHHMEAAHEDDLLRFKTEYETFHFTKL